MKTQRIHNQSEQKELRLNLRKKSTPEEQVLWKILRAKRLDGSHWYRQYSVGKYVLDFYCPAAKLCVEVDGLQHTMEEEMTRDAKRTAFLENEGIVVLRVPNRVVLEQSDMIAAAISQELANRRR